MSGFKFQAMIGNQITSLQRLANTELLFGTTVDLFDINVVEKTKCMFSVVVLCFHSISSLFRGFFATICSDWSSPL